MMNLVHLCTGKSLGQSDRFYCQEVHPCYVILWDMLYAMAYVMPPFLNLVLIEDMYPVFPPLLCNGSIGDYYINHLICRFLDQEETYVDVRNVCIIQRSRT